MFVVPGEDTPRLRGIQVVSNGDQPTLLVSVNTDIEMLAFEADSVILFVVHGDLLSFDID
ncbi:MAG: hypothetical protein DDT28_00802 [Dehalococcoidia bacterium]|nr:hypothetical protein [Chloroflexota bacterium]MBT9160206.1 hypothetical protein [Chloroflexota bacterium]